MTTNNALKTTLKFLLVLFLAMPIGLVIADDDDDDDDFRQENLDETLSFRWNAADNFFEQGSDFIHQVLAGGSLTHQASSFLGPDFDTDDVQGELAGELEGEPKDQSDIHIEKVIGGSTVTTDVHSETRDTDEFEGEILIDGEAFSIHITPATGKANRMTVSQTSVPATTQQIDSETTTIPVTIRIFKDDDDDSNAFSGFGTLSRKKSTSEAPVSVTESSVDELTAELIGENGFFNLNLRRSEIFITFF